MKQLVFFLMTQKGHDALAHYLDVFGTAELSFVVGSKDENIQHDYYEEIKALCSKHGVTFYDRKEKFTVDTNYIIAISWRWLIKQGNAKLIVMHDSLLPKYRGFAPLVNCLVNGERKIGVTALFASNEYDKGNIIAQRSAGISYPIKINDAIDIVSGCYKGLVEEVCKKMRPGQEIESTVQVEADATYSLWLDEEDYNIDWNRDAGDLKRFIDATGYPYNGAATHIDGKKYRIAEAETLPDLIIENRKPGKIIFMENEKPIVVCGTGLLKIISLLEDGTTQEMLPLKRFRIRFT